MNNGLSIKAKDEEIEIKTNRSDIAASLIRGIIGAAPFVGPIVAETLSATIPNQKIDRIITFAKLLEDKIKYLEEDLLKEKFQNEEFADLLEDGLQQASRALSKERKEYIANLLKNGLVNEEQTHLEKKKILSLLNQLNDAEIVMLKYFSLRGDEDREDFANKHRFLKFRDIAEDRLLDEVISEELTLSYVNQLERLGLVKADAEDPTNTTYLGDVLLWQIGLQRQPDNYNSLEMNDALDPFPSYRRL
jgi:hypothetical protein